MKKSEDYKKPMRKFSKAPHTIVVHCSASNRLQDDDISVIAEWHKKRGFSAVGYHFFIKKDGSIQLGRSIEYEGAHVQGHNDYTIGICLSGNTHQDFTAEQFDALEQVVGNLSRNNAFIKNVVAHYELDTNGKTCPNIPAPLLRHWLSQIILRKLTVD